MKTLKILMVSMFLCAFSISQINANAILDSGKQDLIKRLAEDTEMVELFLKTFELATTSSKASLSNESISTVYEEKVSNTMEGYKSLIMKYPELLSLSSPERKEVFMQVGRKILMEDTSNARLNSVRECTVASIKTWAICNGINAGWTLVRFTICSGIAALADLLVLFYSGGSALVAAQLAVDTELAACFTIATGNPITTGGLLVCNGFFAENISACWGGL